MGAKKSMMLDQEMGLPKFMKSKMGKTTKASMGNMDTERYRPYVKSGKYRGKSLARTPKQRLPSMREM